MDVEPTDITVQILGDIRDEITGLRGDLAQTNSRLEHGLGELKAEIVAQGLTLKSEIVAQGLKMAEGSVQIAGELDSIRHLLADGFALQERVDEHDREIEALRQRLDRAGIGG